MTPGQTYTITEAMAGGSTNQLTDYQASIACTDASGAAVATGGHGPSWTITPSAAGAYTCTISNAEPPLDCTTGGTLYLVDSRSGTQLVKYDIATRSTTPVGSSYSSPSYGLGISADGTKAYSVDDRGNVLVYSADKGTFAVAATSGISGVTAGAVDPANGLYYFAAGADLYSFDPATAKVSGPVATLPAAGQLAFDRAGHGYLYAAGSLSLFAVGSATLTPLLDGLPDSVTGIAFGADGYLYLTGDGNAVARVDPADGTLAPLSPGVAGGLAGCANPYLISTAVALPKGAFAASDQFAVSVNGGGDWSAAHHARPVHHRD